MEEAYKLDLSYTTLKIANSKMLLLTISNKRRQVDISNMGNFQFSLLMMVRPWLLKAMPLQDILVMYTEGKVVSYYTQVITSQSWCMQLIQF